MAFDGSVIACITNELNMTILDGRIVKIAQPEKDSLLLTIKKEGNQFRLLISASPSLPMIYLTEKNLPSPITAPSFCMLLRKHLTNARILSIKQPSLERIINFEIEHFNEMGDLCRKTLAVELMGKHSNIILLDDNRIVDSIKHVSALVSSVREVLPERDYFVPFADEKKNPLTIEKDDFYDLIFKDNTNLSKSLYMNLTGISPVLAEEISERSSVNSSIPSNCLNDSEKENVFNSFKEVTEIIKAGNYSPYIYYENSEPVFYSPFDFLIYKGLKKESYDSISTLLYDYYSKKQAYTTIRQKTSALRQIVQGLLSKDYKKYDLQLKQLKDTSKKDKFKLYGELACAYGYNVEPKSTSMKAVDYNTGEEITIPLDPQLSAVDNGKKFFDKYSKLKRTSEALSQIIEETKAEIEHLESIQASLEIVKDAADISELRKEMADSGYIKEKYVSIKDRTKTNKKGKAVKQQNLKSSPLHFVSSDGFDIYVGKNNYQNEYISFKLADSNDYWFHAKKIPGSHVIVKSKGMEVPDSTFEEAASLAAHFSKANSKASLSSDGKVEVDYVQRKFLKKTPGGKPGFVIYHTNYSMTASTDISNIKEIL